MEVARATSPKAQPQPPAEEKAEKPKSAGKGKKPPVQTEPPQELPAHKALLIIASPEGGAIKYELTGVATEPVLDGMVFNKAPEAAKEQPAKGKPAAKAPAAPAQPA